jgi:hypothetical protein
MLGVKYLVKVVLEKSTLLVTLTPKTFTNTALVVVKVEKPDSVLLEMSHVNLVNIKYHLLLTKLMTVSD